VSSPDLDADTQQRQVEVATQDGEPLGACLYLSPEDLHDLGIDPSSAEQLTFAVDPNTGHLVIEAAATPQEVSDD
jgi:hypothetical protein